MEPQVEYAVAADGARIATISLGNPAAERTLLVAATPPWSHVLQEARIPAVRTWMDAVGEDARVIRYDCRGTGLSDRNGATFSVDEQAEDLRTVADHYGLRSFALWGSIAGSPASIVYAARYPARVSHLLLWGAYARAEPLFGGTEFRALGALLRENWEIYADTYAQLMRDAITQEAWQRAARVLARVDVSDAARDIRVPTTVMTRHETRFGELENARLLAGLIPGARLLVLEGSSAAPFLGDTAPVIEAIRHAMAASDAMQPARTPSVQLTARELAVLRLLAAGRSAKEIAGELQISLPTVQRHTANIYSKTGSKGRVQAASYAFAHGLAEPT